VGNWELRRNADLVNPNDPTDIEQSNVIILWSGTRVTKVLSLFEFDGYWIRNPDGSYILGLDNNRILTQGSVVTSEEIAPMGDSGTGNVHLHLGLNGGSDNPLLYLQHPPDTLPSVTIENPPNNHVFTQTELNSDYPIRVRVNSVGGLDFDKLSLWIYINSDPTQLIHLGVPGQHTFSYGGRPDTELTGTRTDTVVESDGNTTGVQPLSLGDDRFVFLQNFSSLNLPEGEHSLVVRARDVNDHIIPEVVHQFYIQKLSILGRKGTKHRRDMIRG
jgi:hypothetical protein